VLLRQGDHAHVLGPGDSCHYDGRVPHTIRNDGAGTARLLVAMTPAVFGQRRRARAEETAGRGGAGPVPAPKT